MLFLNPMVLLYTQLLFSETKQFLLLKSSAQVLVQTQTQGVGGAVSHFYSLAHIYIFPEPLNWLSKRTFRWFYCRGLNILLGIEPVTSYLAAHQHRLLLKLCFKWFPVSLMYVSGAFFFFFSFFSFSCLAGNKTRRRLGCWAYTHWAVYCVALRSSWNFINSVSFYSALIHSFTYCHKAGKFVPPVRDPICLRDRVLT